MRYVIIGNGVAGTTAAARVRALDADAEIDVFTDESYAFYARTRLPEVIGGDAHPEDLVIHGSGWYEGKRINLHLSEAVKSIDVKARAIETAQARYAYDSLLLATGSRSFVPPIKGVDRRGVFTLRSMVDAIAVRNWAMNRRRATVIGGGLLGLEAGNGLRRAGLSVTVVEVFPRLLPRQMDVPGARVLQRQLEEMGFSFRLGAQCTEIVGEDRVRGLMLDNGEFLPSDLILISAGVRPSVELAASAGIRVARGVIVDDQMKTSVPNVFAAGDLTEHNGIIYGIWPASQKQGEVAGDNMAGGHQVFSGIVPSNRLKVVGIDLISAGEIDAEGNLEAVVHEAQGSYRKIVIKDDVIVGCILLGDSRGSTEILRVIEHGTKIGPLKRALHDRDFDFRRLRALEN